MTRQFSASLLIAAPPRDVYAILADYRSGHACILPRPPFVSLDVEQGGVGAGMMARPTLRVLDRTQSFRAVVSEPEPGRILMETTDTGDTGYVTRFIVEPRVDGRQSEVTIHSEVHGRPSLAKALERWFAPYMLRPVYVKELRQLAAVVASLAMTA